MRLSLRPNKTASSVGLAIWDTWVWIGIFFPFITGGIWISRPGLFLELSDLGIPVLIAGIFGLILTQSFKVSLSQTSSVRLIRYLSLRWVYALEHHPKKSLWLGALLWGLLGSLASLRKHQAFESHAYDLGIFTNAIWNLTHGWGYVSSMKGGMNLFTDHQSPVFWLLAPIFYLFPHPETLLILQAFGLATGGVILFYLARQFISSEITQQNHFWIAAILPWLYWLYLPVRNANAFDFHPEVFMLPIFLAAITGLQSTLPRRRIAGAIAFLIALGAKESAGPVATGIGLAWILGAGPQPTQQWTRKIGWGAALLGLGTFLFDTRVVPRILGVEYAYKNVYSQYGQSFFEILLSPLLKPSLLFQQLLGVERRRFILWTLGPLGFLPLFNPTALIAAIPGYIMLFLSAGAHRVSIHYHYGIEAAVGLFFAFPGAYLYLLKKIKFHWIHTLPLWILFWALAMSGRSELFRIRKFTPTPHDQWLAHQVIPCLSSHTSWVASETIVPWMSTRHWVQSEEIPIPQQPEIACWIHDESLSHWPLSSSEEAIKRIPQDFNKTWSCGSVSIYQRSLSSETCMKCRLECESEYSPAPDHSEQSTLKPHSELRDSKTHFLSDNTQR